MAKNYNEILKEELRRVKLSYREISEIKEQTKRFITNINQLLKKYRMCSKGKSRIYCLFGNQFFYGFFHGLLIPERDTKIP